MESEKIVLIAVDTGYGDAESSLDELESLCETAGGTVAARVIQRRESPDRATCIGSGRLLEVKEFAEAESVDLLVFDDELSPSQQRNIEQETGIRTIDRTLLILDIFALRAKSGEGKIQVELAQLKYRLPRLGGQGLSLSRLGGGIGTRGPGESQLESDRRHIRRRITKLKEDLAEVEKRRERLRIRRKKEGIYTVSIMGYTNAGKSTLLNTLTGAGVLAENKLFATLDPTSRGFQLPDGREIMLIDTVGFIKKLPHHLVEAFHSTLEEGAAADIILHVADGSNPDFSEQFAVTENLLKELGCNLDKVITVMNKSDLAETQTLPEAARTVHISALSGEGVDALCEAISELLPADRKRVTVTVPFDKAGIAAKIRAEGAVYSEAYTESGIEMDAVVPIKLLEELR